MTNPCLIALGIDPGYDRCGLAIIKQNYPKAEVLFSTCVVTDRKQSYSERLKQIGEALEQIITNQPINLIGLERIFTANNRSTAIQIGEVRGLILYLAEKYSLPVKEFSPATIKLTVTGSGRADKKQVMNMVGHLTSLPAQKRLDDEFDAIAIALTALAHEPNYPH
jgi:crossover junction endodeoxyribonuclease RuvC